MRPPKKLEGKHWNVGEASPRAKLTAEQVLEIRARSAEGVSGRSLAKQYSVSRALIYVIIHRKNWTHLP
jgi:Mor family transcriptional regulator